MDRPTDDHEVEAFDARIGVTDLDELDLGLLAQTGRDRLGDLELAWNVGARACLVRTGYGVGEIESSMSGWKRKPDLVAENALDAAMQIVESH